MLLLAGDHCCVWTLLAAPPEVPRDTFDESDASFLLAAVMMEHVMNASWEFLTQARGHLDQHHLLAVMRAAGHQDLRIFRHADLPQQRVHIQFARLVELRRIKF